MRGLVQGNTYEVRKRMLESIKTDYLLSGYEITKEINNYSSNYIIFNNGDIWKAVPPRDSARGNKANLSYVDSRITDAGSLSIIRGCTIAQPWNAIKIIYEA